MESTELHLVIKSPSDKLPSHEVTYQQSWSVKDLKQHLCESYPTHPQPPAQRLIYAGKLLSDDTLLSTLFKNPSFIPTIHLVCRNTESTPGNTDNLSSSSTTTPSFTDNISAEEMQQYQRQYYEYLKSFYMAHSELPTSDVAQSWSNVYPYPMQGFAWPYFQSWTGVSGSSLQGYFPYPTNPINAQANSDGSNMPGQPFWSAMNQANGAAPEREPAPVPPAQQQQQQPQQQQQAMLLGNPMAGGLMGADDMGENAGNLDIVDRFYMIFRLSLFIGLCFAYSSLDKAIIVFSVAAYVYFYNIYRRHAALRRVAAAANENHQEPADTSSAPTQAASESTSTDQQQPGPSEQQLRERIPTQLPEPPTQQQPQVQPAPDPETRMMRIAGTVRSVLSISFQFFSSLITSLIPEQPPPIRLD